VETCRTGFGTYTSSLVVIYTPTPAPNLLNIFNDFSKDREWTIFKMDFDNELKTVS